MTTTDRRSVGELLADADRASRLLLLDVRGEDAPAMLRTWGEVVQSAADLWAVLPSAPRARPSADAGAAARLDAMAQGLHRTQLRRGWPGDGPDDERLLAIAETLTRAADLVTRLGGQARPSRPAVAADVDAARMRIMHALYVGAHGVSVATKQHVVDLEATARRPRAPISAKRAATSGRDALARMGAFEVTAGAYVGSRFAAVARGQVVEPAGTAVRLSEALAAWDLQVHRTLAASPSSANLMSTTRMQASIATVTTVIAGAAAVAGDINQDAYVHQLAPALRGAEKSWADVAGRWGEFVPPTPQRPDPALVRAGSELTSAMNAIALDHGTWASPGVMASRVDLPDAYKTLQQSLAAAVDVAHITRECAATVQDLKGPARTMSQRAESETGISVVPGTQDIPWVSTADMHANRMVAVPDPVRTGLVDASESLVTSTSRAMSAGSSLTEPVPPAARASTHSTISCGRSAHDRTPTVTGPAMSFGCDR